MLFKVTKSSELSNPFASLSIVAAIEASSYSAALKIAAEQELAGKLPVGVTIAPDSLAIDSLARLARSHAREGERIGGKSIHSCSSVPILHAARAYASNASRLAIVKFRGLPTEAFFLLD